MGNCYLKMNVRNAMKKIESLNELKSLAAKDDGVEVVIRLINGALSSKTVKYFETPLPATNEIWGDGNQTDLFFGREYIPMGVARRSIKVIWSVRHEVSDSESEHTCDQSFRVRTRIVRAIDEGSLFLIEE